MKIVFCNTLLSLEQTKPKNASPETSDRQPGLTPPVPGHRPRPRRNRPSSPQGDEEFVPERGPDTGETRRSARPRRFPHPDFPVTLTPWHALLALAF